MGFKKEKRPLLTMKGVDSRYANKMREGQDLQSLTGASTGTEIRNYGPTYILVTSSTEATGETLSGATGTNISFSLANPVAGAQKQIVIENDSTAIVQVRVAPSSATFIAGTTMNALRWTTGTTDVPAWVQLLGLSTTEWAVAAIASTAIGYAGSTY